MEIHTLVPANRCWSEWAKGNGDPLNCGCDIFTDGIFLPAQVFCDCFHLWVFFYFLLITVSASFFSSFLPIPIRSNVRGVSPKLIEFLLLLLCERVVRNRHWSVRVLPRAGWDWQGGGRKLPIPAWASPSTEHVVSSPSALPLKPQHFARKKTEKNKRQKGEKCSQWRI